MPKIALITGGTGGLGSRLALMLCKNGYKIAVNYKSNELQSKKLLNEMGGDAAAFKADVGNIEEVIKMSEALYELWGIPDVLINSAGITRDALTLRARAEDWDRVMRVNLKGVFNTTQVFSRLMKLRGGGGHIVNISSYSGLKGKKGQAAYSASKSALIGFSKTAAMELAEFGIKVNVILPGYMATEMGKRAWEAMARAKEESVLKKLSEPDEVAGFIANLVETEGVTGQVFPIESRIL
jgi:NAD(P)-dependent dehydrogenase (short-subunit alcohol dehydrogenase family)